VEAFCSAAADFDALAPTSLAISDIDTPILQLVGRRSGAADHPPIAAFEFVAIRVMSARRAGSGGTDLIRRRLDAQPGFLGQVILKTCSPVQCGRSRLASKWNIERKFGPWSGFPHFAGLGQRKDHAATDQNAAQPCDGQPQHRPPRPTDRSSTTASMSST